MTRTTPALFKSGPAESVMTDYLGMAELDDEVSKVPVPDIDTTDEVEIPDKAEDNESPDLGDEVSEETPVIDEDEEFDDDDDDDDDDDVVTNEPVE